ncbi:outer membrane beta-barrel protein [Pontibacter ruber]|uniref:Outer membrane beta-barrel protein n=1 Tax=Pontibacter ruber TaxID=1343895 RepID=A0ABW5CZ91_9BACT|nr:outer membrane beta-barrel protein [Pontibacter ruber]
MKTLLTVLLFLAMTFSAIAQQPDSTYIEKGKFTVGLDVSFIPFHIYYKEPKGSGAIRSGYFVPISLTAGYQLSRRANVRVGLGFGGDKDEGDYTVQDVKYEVASKTFAIAGSVSFSHIFFNLYRKFPIYGTLSVIPAYGITKGKMVATNAEGSSTLTTRDTGMDVFATAGVGFNYKISKRFYGDASYYFYKRNLTGRNSFDHDWESYAPLPRRIFKSLEFGVNYKL